MSLTFVKWGLDVAKAPPPVQASLEPIIRFFSYHDAHPVALMMVLLEKFGTEWLEWEAETLRHEIITTFKATSISDQNWQKIQASRVLIGTTSFWNEWPVFEKMIQALNNNMPRLDITQRCTMSQLSAGVDIANTIRKEPFGDEVARYISACALDEGVCYLPPPLEFAQTLLSHPTYHCNVCGKVDHDDMGDGKCDFCSGRFQTEHPFSMKPHPDAALHAGSDVRKYRLYDHAPIKARYELMLKNGPENLSEDNTEDVQAAKLVVAHEYMLLRNRQLAEQLEELKSWLTL